MTETEFNFSDQSLSGNGIAKKKPSHIPLFSRPTERKCCQTLSFDVFLGFKMYLML